MAIPNPDDNYCNELDELFFSFLWNHSQHMIKKRGNCKSIWGWWVRND